MENMQEIKDSVDCLSLGTGNEGEASGSTPRGVQSMEKLEGEVGVFKDKMQEMDVEVQKLNELQDEVEKQFNTNDLLERSSADNNSVYVGNVDYGTTVMMLEEHFQNCGPITRVTIPMDRFNGTPKGFAYIEFGDQESMQMALSLDDSVLRGRPIKVVRKRTNRPGLSRGRPPFGRGFRGSPRGGFDTRPGRGGFNNGFSRPRMYSNNMFYMPY